jgi:chromosome segregation ATPase
MKNFKLTLLALTISAALPALAQTTAQEGLGKLKTNLNNSKMNLQDYQKNLKIVDANVVEVSKARAQVEEQKQKAAASLKENNEKLAALDKNELEINKLIAVEQKEIQSEDQKIQELQKVINQLKDNQAKRNQNILGYQEQLKQQQKDKLEWKTRGDQINKSYSNLEARSKSLISQENDWKAKQRGYQGEVSRWQKEVERQGKLNDNYQSLSEVKE